MKLSTKDCGKKDSTKFLDLVVQDAKEWDKMDSTEIVQEEAMDKFIDRSLTKLGYFTQSEYKQIWYEEQQAIQILRARREGKGGSAVLREVYSYGEGDLHVNKAIPA